MMERILDVSEWPLVAPIVMGLFKDSMPATPLQATFSAIFDEKRLAAFVQVETLFHFTNLYVDPEYRGRGLAQRLLTDATNRTPEGFSSIVLTDERAIARIAMNLGARDVGTWRYLRKDY